MKKLYFMLIAVIAGITTVKATIRTISVADFKFSPSAVNANVGDTIRWVWSSGTHTTTSGTIPNGATSWNANINSGNTTFDYVIPVAGTYNYFCSIHPQMTGTINATSGTGISQLTASLSMSAFPNPFRDKITLSHHAADGITVLNMVGAVVADFTVESAEVKTILDLSSLPAGVYFVSTSKEGVITGTKRIVKGE